MEQEGRTTSASRAERTLVNDPEKTAVVPRFDEKSVRRARPAVPFGGAARRARRVNPLVVLVVAVGLLGVVSGAVGTYLYQSRRPGPEAAPARPSDDAAARPAAETTAGDAAQEAASAAQEPASAASEEELFEPATSDLPDAAPPAPEEAPRAGGAPVEIRPAGDAEAEAGAAGSDAGAEGAALRAALGEWVGATNARDIERQMEFYHPRLDAYYLSRGTPAAAVRAEKERVFGRAAAIDVRAAAPAIRFSRDGRTATMRFRKSYHIGGGGQDRRGEVVQELRWRKTPAGWKIVSERDVRVLN